MRENRVVARIFAGLLVVGALALGAAAPAQAKDSGWNGTVAPASAPTVKAAFLDSGWNGT